ncbi:MAG: hypothetical protein AAFN78_04290 [Pseudomonadota bacterium]
MKLTLKTALLSAIAGMLCVATNASAASSTTVGFDGGSDGGFIGNAFFEATGGNPDGSAHHLVQAFGVSLRTGGEGEPANDAFLGDYSQYNSVTISFDIKVNSITDFIGNELPRAIGISLIDRDVQGPSGPAGVFFEMGVVSADLTSEWTTLTAIIEDTSSIGLPNGWVGFGDEDPNTFEPILPDGATFASVLASVDQFEITTLVPGFFFTFANYDVRIDNVSIKGVASPVPLPGAVWLFGAATAFLAGWRRRPAA